MWATACASVLISCRAPKAAEFAARINSAARTGSDVAMDCKSRALQSSRASSPSTVPPLAKPVDPRSGAPQPRVPRRPEHPAPFPPKVRPSPRGRRRVPMRSDSPGLRPAPESLGRAARPGAPELQLRLLCREETRLAGDCPRLPAGGDASAPPFPEPILERASSLERAPTRRTQPPRGGDELLRYRAGGR